jgi:DMSO/TMAO reductase YedYZ heme-binding membrane subunit
MLAVLDPKLPWYISRASGLVSWALLAGAVLWGLLLSTKTLSKSTPPSWLLALHRHLGGLAVVFVVVHMGALLFDDYAPFTVEQLLVPMASDWEPGAVAWGVAAFYLLVAIELTSLLGRRFPKRWWRRIHQLSFPLFVVATVHLFVAGTERHNQVIVGAALVVSTLVGFLVVVRLLAQYAPRPATPRVPAAAREAAPSRVPASAGDAAPSRVPAAARARAARARAAERRAEPETHAAAG